MKSQGMPQADDDAKTRTQGRKLEETMTPKVPRNPVRAFSMAVTTKEYAALLADDEGGNARGRH